MFVAFEIRLKKKIDEIHKKLKKDKQIVKLFKNNTQLRQYILLKLAQDNLYLYIMLTHKRYKGSWAHEYLCKKLEKVESGKTKRLVVIAPPRFGKSEISSVRFPTWYLGKNPYKKVMAVSYNASLVNDFGRHSRNCISSLEFKTIFGIDVEDENLIPQLSKDSKSVNRFALIQDGEYIGQGLGGGVTGKGGHVILIDDWIKSHRDLTSKKLEDDWEYYQSTLYNRQEFDEGETSGAIVVVQTHWHKKDLIGRLLEEQEKNGDKWEKVHLMAEAEKDEYYNKSDFYWYE